MTHYKYKFSSSRYIIVFREINHMAVYFIMHKTHQFLTPITHSYFSNDIFFEYSFSPSTPVYKFDPSFLLYNIIFKYFIYFIALFPLHSFNFFFKFGTSLNCEQCDTTITDKNEIFRLLFLFCILM